MHTDMQDGSLITDTAEAAVEYGWTTFIALERKQASHTVDTTAGGVTTVDTVKMSLSRASNSRVTTYCAFQSTSQSINQSIYLSKKKLRQSRKQKNTQLDTGLSG